MFRHIDLVAVIDVFINSGSTRNTVNALNLTCTKVYNHTLIMQLNFTKPSVIFVELLCTTAESNMLRLKTSKKICKNFCDLLSVWWMYHLATRHNKKCFHVSIHQLYVSGWILQYMSKILILIASSCFQIKKAHFNKLRFTVTPFNPKSDEYVTFMGSFGIRCRCNWLIN